MRFSIYIIVILLLAAVPASAGDMFTYSMTGENPLNAYMPIKLHVSNNGMQNDHEHDHDQAAGHFSIAVLIKPAGIVTAIFLFTTLTLGLLMKKNRKVIFPWHRRCAIVTGCVAIVHVLLVMFH